MTMSVKDGGAFKIATPSVKDAGVWKAVQHGYVKDAGVWKEFFTSMVVAITHAAATAFTTSPATATARYQLDAAGTVSATQALSALAVRGEWINPNSEASGSFECRATLLTGTISGTFGTWQTLDSNRQWTMVALSGNGVQNATMTLEIRRAGVVLTTSTISFTAESIV